MSEHQGLYTCYTELAPRKIEAEGAIVGSYDDVLAWMRDKFGTLSSEVTGDRMVHAAAFFYDGDCEEFWLADGTPVFLAELQEGDFDL